MNCSSNEFMLNLLLAPKNVFMLLSASGVTKTILLEVFSVTRKSLSWKNTPELLRSFENKSPKLSLPIWPMKEHLPPNDLNPTAVFAALPPEIIDGFLISFKILSDSS